MKFGLVASVLLLSANAAFASELLSPISGAVIRANDKLNITLKTYHYGRAHTDSITAYLLQNDGLCGEFSESTHRILTDFEPNYTWIDGSGVGYPSYTTESLYHAGWYAKGDVTLVVEERFTTPGTSNFGVHTSKIQIVE